MARDKAYTIDYNDEGTSFDRDGIIEEDDVDSSEAWHNWKPSGNQSAYDRGE